MAGCHLAEVVVGFKTGPLIGLQLVWGQHIIEEFRHAIGVVSQATAFWRGQRGVFDGLPNPLDQLGANGARRHLCPKLLLLRCGQDSIHPRQKCPQRQTHTGGSITRV